MSEAVQYGTDFIRLSSPEEHSVHPSMDRSHALEGREIAAVSKNRATGKCGSQAHTRVVAAGDPDVFESAFPKKMTLVQIERTTSRHRGNRLELLSTEFASRNMATRYPWIEMGQDPGA